MRILGLDLGTTSIKAVEIESAFRRFEIHEYYEQKIESGSDPLQATKALFTALPKVPDRIAIALKTGNVTFRNLQIPTRDRKAIQTGVKFELEDELPFDLDQAVFDYVTLSQSGQISQIHVSATLRQYLDTALNNLSSIGIDPDLITTEAWAYRTLLNRILPQTEKERPILLVKIGNERTILYVHWSGFPVMTREFPWGGRDLTTSICRKYGIPLEQAEQTKRDHGFVLPPSQKAQAAPDQVEFSDVILQPLEELIREIRQTKLICKNITHEHLYSIYLTGGTSVLPGLLSLIEEEVQIKTKPLKGLSQLASSGVSYSEETDASFLLAASLALTLVGTDRTQPINLRKGNLAKQAKSRELNYENMKRPLKAVAAITISLILSIIVQTQVFHSRLKTIDSQLEKSIRGFFGQVAGSAIRTYLSNPSTLRDSIKKDLSKAKELAKLYAPNPHSPTAFLRELSLTIPKDTVVDLLQYTAGSSPTANYSPTENDSAELSFLVSNPQNIERLSNVMSIKMTGGTKPKTEEISSSDGASKKWKITFTGKPIEAAYGK